jgi:ABC-type polysaccharide/polyol phosphate transport system ATPase subunit
MNAIELSGVSKRYNIYDRPIDRLKELVLGNTRSFHREFWALRDVDLTFRKGNTTAVIGPNGSGKSTLLQIIAGVLTPSTGTVTIRGLVTAILELGAGFQPDHTGRENVLLNGMILGLSREEMLAKLDGIQEFAGIGDFFDQPVKTYSSGMVVRLAFACAVAVEPEILLVDEALAVGDANFQFKCFRRIEALRDAGKTIILVTHDMRPVEKICHEVVLFNGGHIVATGTPSEVIPQYNKIMDTAGAIEPKHFTDPAAFFDKGIITPSV